MDAARGAPSIITLIVVTPIIRGHVYVYAREDALRVRTFDNDSRVYIYREVPIRCGPVSLDERKHDLVSHCFEQVWNLDCEEKFIFDRN